MKLNSQGLVEAVSVQNIERVFLKRKESEPIKLKLAKARNYGKVQIGQIAVIDGREFLRVDPSKFNGSAWLEIK